jgi:hypothetical protein
MLFSADQVATLKAWIDANYPSAALTVDGSAPIAAALNTAAAPAFLVWRTLVSVDEVMRNGMDWTRVDNLTVGKSRIWDWMTRLGTINPSRANIRAGIDATWVGTTADLAVRATVYGHCRRAATVLEKLFATGTGSEASPATLATDVVGAYLEGEISAAEVWYVRTSA